MKTRPDRSLLALPYVSVAGEVRCLRYSRPQSMALIPIGRCPSGQSPGLWPAGLAVADSRRRFSYRPKDSGHLPLSGRCAAVVRGDNNKLAADWILSTARQAPFIMRGPFVVPTLIESAVLIPASCWLCPGPMPVCSRSARDRCSCCCCLVPSRAAETGGWVVEPKERESVAAHPLLDPSGLPTTELAGSLLSGQSPIRFGVCLAAMELLNHRLKHKSTAG